MSVVRIPTKAPAPVAAERTPLPRRSLAELGGQPERTLLDRALAKVADRSPDVAGFGSSV